MLDLVISAIIVNDQMIIDHQSLPATLKTEEQKGNEGERINDATGETSCRAANQIVISKLVIPETGHIYFVFSTVSSSCHL